MRKESLKIYFLANSAIAIRATAPVCVRSRRSACDYCGDVDGVDLSGVLRLSGEAHRDPVALLVAERYRPR
jgi:hypothetical protein